MKRKILLAAAGLTGFLAITGFRAAGGWGCHGHGDPERANAFITSRVNDHLDELDASEAQRTEVLALKDELFKQGQEVFAAGREDKAALLKQWDSTKPDADAVHALVDGHLDRIRTLAHDVADAALRLHAILTPEQRAEVSTHLHARVDGR